MIHQLSSFSAEKASPWPPLLLQEQPRAVGNEIREYGFGLWYGVAIGLPISLLIWAGVAGIIMELL